MQGKQKPGKPDKTNKQIENKTDPARQEEGLTSPDLDSRQAPDVPEHPTNLEQRRRRFRHLQRSVGNRQVNNMIGDRGSEKVPDVMPVFENDFGILAQRPNTVAAILSRSTPDDIVHLSDAAIREASLQQKMSLVHLINWGNAWVGPLNELQLERIWRITAENREEFGRALNQYPRYFQESIRFGADIAGMDPIPELMAQFQLDVVGLANRYLNSNEQLILNTLSDMGVPQDELPRSFISMTTGAVRPITEQNIANVQEIQAVAAKIRRAQLAQEELKQIPIGHRFLPRVTAQMVEIPPLSQAAAEQRHQREPERFAPSTFNPRMPPQYRPFGDENPAYLDWEEVKAQYDILNAQIAQFASRYPVLNTLIQEDRVEEFALGSPMQARQVMVSELMPVLGNIERSRAELSSGHLDYRDLVPIHHQLKQGQVTPDSGTNYTEGINRSVMEFVVEEHEDSEFWWSLGLGSLAAAAFLVAEFATLGSATFIAATLVGVGASGTQAAMSWDQYETLATAADASLTDESRLISQDQADMALFTAVMDSVFLFLDMAGPAMRAVRELGPGARAANLITETVEAGTQSVGLESLARIGTEVTEESANLVSRSVTELGVEETMRRTGKSVDELLQHVAPDSNAYARLVAFRRMGQQQMRTTAQLVEALPRLSDDLAGGVVREGRQMTAAMADEIVQQAIERLGPQRTLELAGGWKKLSTTLGNLAPSRKGLISFRDQVYADLEAFVTQNLRTEGQSLEEQLIKRTGTDDFTSDIDISLLGPNASANRQEAISFLSGRLGVPPERMGNLLYMDLFTDPRRMHLYDLIPDSAIRERIAREAAGFERELIMNRRLYDARRAGNQELVDSILFEMRSPPTVREVGYTPMTPDEIRHASRELDELHAAFRAAEGNAARQGELATEIARKQAMINASERGGYFSGGGVRTSVSERENFPGFTEAERATEARRMLPEQEFTHVLDQMPKMDQAIGEFRRVAGRDPMNPTDLARALKGVGKYGERFTEVVGSRLGSEIPAREVFDNFADELANLINSSRSTAAVSLSEQIARDTDGLVRRVGSSLDNFEAWSEDLVRLMQNRANITTPGIHNLRNMQYLLRAHSGFLRLKANLLFQLSTVGRMVRLGTASAVRESVLHEGSEQTGPPD